jgi:hypothetical protein
MYVRGSVGSPAHFRGYASAAISSQSEMILNFGRDFSAQSGNNSAIASLAFPAIVIFPP